MKLFPEERFPELPLLGIEAVPVKQDLKIGQRRRVPRRDPQGKIVKEVQMHEMVLVPVAEPDHLHALFGAEPDEPLPAGGGIDQNARAFDIEGMAEGVATPIFAREETDRSEGLLFHGDLQNESDYLHPGETAAL
jgi:hypothetical protein